MHPRMIAFAIGVLALGCVLRKRTVTAIVLVALAAVVHPTTALWFGLAVGVSSAAALGIRRPWRWVALGLAVAAAVAGRRPPHGRRVAVRARRQGLPLSIRVACLCVAAQPELSGCAVADATGFALRAGNCGRANPRWSLGLLVLVAAFGCRYRWRPPASHGPCSSRSPACSGCSTPWWCATSRGGWSMSSARALARVPARRPPSILIVLAIGRGAFMLVRHRPASGPTRSASGRVDRRHDVAAESTGQLASPRRSRSCLEVRFERARRRVARHRPRDREGLSHGDVRSRRGASGRRAPAGARAFRRDVCRGVPRCGPAVRRAGARGRAVSAPAPPGRCESNDRFAIHDLAHDNGLRRTPSVQHVAVASQRPRHDGVCLGATPAVSSPPAS